ncbi:MAG TPA: hypothetical protein VGS27_24420 [Candidatus Sulfotelmatobacter sp.]|nr:hypothetical protein [Candidatus Sulfotelmatobacter sp.]
MNLFEMLAFMLFSAMLLGLGWLLSFKWGIYGLLVTGVPVGTFWVVVMFFNLRASIVETKQSLTRRPRCRNDKCGRRQYTLVSATTKQAVFRCKCGDQYLSESGHFSQMLKDGSVLPYMVRDSSGNWKLDKGLPGSD